MNMILTFLLIGLIGALLAVWWLWRAVKKLQDEKQEVQKEAEENEKVHKSIESWDMLFATTATEASTNNLGIQQEVTTLEKVVVPVFQQIQGDTKKYWMNTGKIFGRKERARKTILTI